MGFRALLVVHVFIQWLLVLISAADPSVCRAVWVFKVPCTQPRTAMVNQVKAWGTYKCYDSQEQCSYEIVKEMPGYIEVKHSYLSTQKTMALNFTFKPPAAPSFCSVRGLSSMMPPVDSSPYCLLHNLVNGSGITQMAGYREICNTAMCPSMELATCSTDN
ncbi:uncharacterized protein ACNS7B_019972 [Menidia menidia]